MTTATAIPSGTAAATAAADITVASGASIQVWTTPKLSGDEWVNVYRTDGGSIEEAVVEGNDPVVIRASRASMVLNGPATFRLKKSATDEAVAVLYDS